MPYTYNHQCIEDIAAYNVSDGDVRTAFQSRRDADRQFGSGSSETTMVRPITMEGMRKRLAMDAAPSVSPLAPKRMRRRPPRRERISMRILFFVQI